MNPAPSSIRSQAALPTQKPLGRPLIYTIIIGCSALAYFSLAHFINGVNHANATAPQNTDSWGDGYSQGMALGTQWGKQRMDVPAAVDLHTSALRACRMRVHPPDEASWTRGYESGFETGYKQATKAAF